MISVDATALVILALVFVLVLILKNLFFEPLAQAMEERERRVKNAQAQWDEAAQSIDAADSRIAKAVQSARNEGYSLLDSVRGEATESARAEVDRERTAAQEKIQKAVQTLSDQTDQALADLETRSDDLAAEIATKILGRDVA